MTDLVKRYLFNKRIFIQEHEPHMEYAFQVLFALSKKFNIQITEGKELLSIEHIELAAEELGIFVPLPFYKGFPDSVRKLSPDELLFDQLVHYTITYGFGDFSHPGGSIMEEHINRLPFNEYADEKEFKVVTKDEASKILKGILDDLCSSSRPLDDLSFKLLLEQIKSCNYIPTKINSKNTLIKLLVETKNLELAKFLAMSDVIKLLDHILYYSYPKCKRNKYSLKNQDRAFISDVIDKIALEGFVDIKNCYEKKKRFAGLLHHIHYTPVSDKANYFVNEMRGSENDSVYSSFEACMENGDIKGACDEILKKGSGALLRNLNYLVSRATPSEIEYIVSKIDSSNLILLIQLYLSYAYPDPQIQRTFTYYHYNKLHSYQESVDEARKRKSYLSKGILKVLQEKIYDLLKTKLQNRVGKVYIDENMKNIALPLNESASNLGFDVLPKGSRIPLPKGKKIRAFTYWEKVNDIDLSVIALLSNGDTIEYSWRSMYGLQSEAITFSGDQTSGFEGGSEYFDIDIEKYKELNPKAEYLILSDNSFSAIFFNDCYVKAGYMLRDIQDSGEVFEPKTVASSFRITTDSYFSYLYAIDLKTNEFVWLNMGNDSFKIIAGLERFEQLKKYINVTKLINVYSLFEMMATEIVNDPNEADIIVSDKVEVEGKENIHSYDFEKLISYLNK